MNPTFRPPARIVCAAMRMDDGHIVTGIRHYSPEMRATLRRLYPCNWFERLFKGWNSKPYHLHVVEQGFVDQYGQFHDRETAWLIAERRGQIREQVSIPGTLYSENLY